MITFCYFTRNRLEPLKESIKSLEETVKISDPEILIIEDSSNNESRARFDPFFNKKNIRIMEIPIKSSCAELLNYCIMFSKTKYICTIGDDIKFLNGNWFEEIQKFIYYDRDYALMHGHSVYFINKEIIPKIGWFDERFLGGGMEDVDMLARLEKMNFRIDSTEEVLKDSISHIKIDRGAGGEWASTHNRKFFAQKWGSMNHPVRRDQSQLIDNIDWHPRQTEFYKHAYKEKKLVINDSIAFMGKKDNLNAFKCKLECGHYVNFGTNSIMPKEIKCQFCGTDNFR